MRAHLDSEGEEGEGGRRREGGRGHAGGGLAAGRAGLVLVVVVAATVLAAVGLVLGESRSLGVQRLILQRTCTSRVPTRRGKSNFGTVKSDGEAAGTPTSWLGDSAGGVGSNGLTGRSCPSSNGRHGSLVALGRPCIADLSGQMGTAPCCSDNPPRWSNGSRPHPHHHLPGPEHLGQQLRRTTCSSRISSRLSSSDATSTTLHFVMRWEWATAKTTTGGGREGFPGRSASSSRRGGRCRPGEVLSEWDSGTERATTTRRGLDRRGGRPPSHLLQRGGDRREDEVVAFVAPPMSRVACAAKSQMLRARLDELQEEEADGKLIEDTKKSLADAETWAKAAGGATPAKLRNEVLAERRKIEKRQDAVLRAAKATADKRSQLEDVAKELEAMERQEKLALAKLEYSKDRYAYLVGQQAAEARAEEQGEDVQRAVDALRTEVGLLPPGTRQYLDLITSILQPMCRDRRAGRGAINDAGLASGDSDVDVVSQDGDEHIDDEHEITQQMLDEERRAKKALQEARHNRNIEVDEAIFRGKPMRELLDQHGAKVHKAIAASKQATAKVEEARSRARARMERERKQEEERRREEGTIEDLIPCPPPAKWRRAEEATSESEDTVDETPVLPEGVARGARRLPGDATTQTKPGPSEAKGSEGPHAQQPHTAAQLGGVGLRRYAQGSTSTQDTAADDSAMQVDMPTRLADGAVMAAEAAARLKNQEDAAARCTRTERTQEEVQERPQRRPNRASSQQPRGSEERSREDRSKSPRRTARPRPTDEAA